MEKLLLHPASLDSTAQQALLSEVEPVFTQEDNQKLLTPPSEDSVYKTVCRSNLHAAPGTDGIPSYIYKECWDILGGPLVDVMREVFKEQELPLSMRTSLKCLEPNPRN